MLATVQTHGLVINVKELEFKKRMRATGGMVSKETEWQVNNLVYVYSVLLAVLGHRTQHLLLVRQVSVLLDWEFKVILHW